TNNNTRIGNLIGVGYGPDLVIENIGRAASAQRDDRPSVEVRVRKQGTTAAYSSFMRLFASSDALPSPDDLDLGGGPLTNPVQSGQCATVTAATSQPLREGIQYLGAELRFVGLDELITTNNTRIGNVIAVGYGPDLVIESVVGPASALPSDRPGVEVRVCNQGTTAAYSAFIRLFASSDALPSPDDLDLGGAPLTNPLEPGQCATVTAATWQPLRERIQYLGAELRFVGANELITTNNTRMGNRIAVSR